jgi:hypothetical protein
MPVHARPLGATFRRRARLCNSDERLGLDPELGRGAINRARHGMCCTLYPLWLVSLIILSEARDQPLSNPANGARRKKGIVILRSVSDEESKILT